MAVVVLLILLLLRDPRARVVHMAVMLMATVSTGSGLHHAEPFEIGLHFPQVQGAVGSSPLVDHVGDGLEGGGVATALAGAEAAADEEVAVDELMQKGRDQEAAAVLGIPEDRRRQDNQCLEATVVGAGAAQGRRADDVVVVPGARFVGPVPHDTLAQTTVEEDLVGGREDALQGVVV